jgi:crotonobetainyl-CoA:carnitine CoA-transferase CaiB-like acyl-CoA transferase
MLMWGRTLSIGVREAMYSPVVNNYTAGDGRAFWIVGLEGDRHWPALARAVGHPEWITDERFETLTARAINARELIGLLDEIFATRPLDEWAGVFETEPELFWSPVNAIEDVVADEQFLAAKSVVDVPDEQSSMPMLATPVDFNGDPPLPRFRAPHPGEHTREILAELELSPDDIEALVDSGVAIAGTAGGS